jgi:hypothetical protein
VKFPWYEFKNVTSEHVTTCNSPSRTSNDDCYLQSNVLPSLQLADAVEHFVHHVHKILVLDNVQGEMVESGGQEGG